ncbi:MAG: hypothetical protein LUG13_01955 [Oscillospiraceae bacterium]|nr:hypothetical protein [Oscillospiraceae bacterium]
MSMIEINERDSEIERRLGEKISDCFSGGELRRRELRLTEEEARRAARLYPVTVRPLGQSWYEIVFQGAEQHAI